MTNPPPTPPDPALWTWTDTFDRTFLGPDYTVTSNANAGATVTDGELVIGPMSLQSNPGTLRTTVTLSADRWQAPDLQLQLDHRWAPTAGNPAQSPILELTVVGETKNLRWDGEHLTWGNVTLGTASGVPSVSGTSYRTRLTADPTQGRLQVSRNGDGLLDVLLPADWDAGIGAGGTVQVSQASRNGGSDFTPVRTFIGSLAVRRGDGTADLSTGTANSSGGIRLGGEWRFAPGPPDDSVGSDGDVWADSTTGTLSQKQSGTYVNVMQLLGAPGPQGLQGVQGVPGPKGDPGALTGTINVPVLLGDASPEGGLIIPVTAGGGLAGYELLGVDGPPVTLATSPDGAAWTELALPATLTVGTQLRLTRTDTTGGVSVLRARLRQDGTAPGGGDGGGGGELLIIHPDGHVTDTFGRAVLGDPYTVQVGGFVSPAAPEIQAGAVRFHLPAGTAAAPDDGSLVDVGEHARIRLPGSVWDSGTGPVQIGFDLTHVSSAATAGDPPMTQFRVFLLGGALEWCWAISTDGGGELWFGTTEPDGQMFLNDWNVYSFDAPEDPTGAWVLTLDTAGGRVRAAVGGVDVMNEPLPAEFLSGGGGQVALGVWRSRIPVGSGTDWPEQTVTLDNLTITAG